MSRVLPVRTCVGCRERATKSELLRVVVLLEGPHRSVAPDEAGKQPGRGAHLHPRPDCLDQAERRHAFPRALRQEGPLDTTALRVWIEAHQHHGQTSTEDLASAEPG